MEQAPTEDDLDFLCRIKYPHLAREHVLDLMRFAARHRLNAWANHVCGEIRIDENDRPRLVIMVQVEGLITRAHETREFVGNELPDIIYDGDRILRATCEVSREINGRDRTFRGEAYFDHLYPGPGISTFWDRMPERMIGKCAMAAALRIAFPDHLSGLYCPEEMDQARRGRMSAAPAPAGPADAPPGEDAPQDRTQLQLRMIDLGIRDPRRREEIVAEFRTRYRHMGDAPVFYAAVFNAIRQDPAAYGGQAPAA